MRTSRQSAIDAIPSLGLPEEQNMSGGRACPICNGASRALDYYSRARIAEGLKLLTGEELSLPPETSDYELRRCNRCELEFSNPMSAPGRAFYECLSEANVQYPDDRWEWQTSASMLARVAANSSRRIVVVDVGCGDGKFLRMLDETPGIDGVGIDLNRSSLEACRVRGLTVIEGTLESTLPHLPGTVDAFTFWHVIEHVESPLALLELARTRLASSGMILFSVPLSPMSYEHSWPDPLNAPPHHLTRWNLRSLQALADRLGMSIQITLPEAERLIYRVARCLLLQATPAFRRMHRLEKSIRLLAFILRKPWSVPIEAWRQLNIPRVGGKVRPDVALVCLTP